jgi:NAD+ synthetase
MNKTIAMCQMMPEVGNIKGNTEKVKNLILKHKDCDFIVFPELAISGYNCGDLFEKKMFIEECEYAIVQIIDYLYEQKIFNPVIIIGCPHKKKNDLYNSAYIINNGNIASIYNKQLLANDYHHEDRKYFKPGNASTVYYLGGIKFGILICEDGWKTYGRDIANEYYEDGAEIIFSINYSYFTYNKIEARTEIFKHDHLPMVYVNAVGVGDISKNFITYDGHSFIYNPYGVINKYEHMPMFKEISDEVIYNTQSRNLSSHFPTSIGHDKYWLIFKAISFSIKNIFREIGLNKTQVHISGGVDSAVVAVLAVHALGSENCVFITQPSKNNGSETLENAEYIAKKLGVPLQYEPISEYVALYKKENPDFNNAEIACFEATVRKSLGFAKANRNKTGILACGNHTENVLGWFTYGDIGSMGVLQPIGDLTKTEIFELCEFINCNKNDEIIPTKLFDGSMKPAAELEDSKEDPFDYYLMSFICERIIRYGEVPSEIMSIIKMNGNFSKYPESVLYDNVILAWHKSKLSVYKRAQSAPVLILSNRSIGFSSRETIIDHYK